jgi:hypothetical protein
VKLGKNASDTCAVLYEALKGEAVKSQVFLSDINDLKRVERTWKIMKEVIVKDFTEPTKMSKRIGIWCNQIDV